MFHIRLVISLLLTVAFLPRTLASNIPPATPVSTSS